MKTKLLLSVLLCILFVGVKAQYTAISITSGFNADVVANGVGAPTTSTNNDVDGVNYIFIAPDYQYDATCALPTESMPAGGSFTSSTTVGLSFQLASYSANQDLRLTSTDSGVLTFASGISAQTVYVLAMGGSGNAEMNISVNFSDGTRQLFNAVNVNDWFTTSTNVAINGIGRINTSATACSVLTVGTTPILFQLALQLSSLNYLKTITSITVTRVDGVSGYAGVVNVFGVSTLAPPTNCTGTPNPGNTISSSYSICPSVNYTLSLQNPLTNSAGISYQWQSSPDSSTWTNISGATSPAYTTSSTVVTYYHCIVTCTLSSSTATSSNIKVNINPAALCICSPNNGTTLHGGTSPYIDSVSIQGTILNNNSPGAPANGYTLFNSTIPTLLQGGTYTLYTLFSGTAIASVWFDWNNDGILDASEWTQITTSGSDGTISFTVPANAVTGKSIMRVRARASGNQNGATDACTEFFSGETEDYVINITGGTPCSGTPVAGVTIPSSTTVCSGIGFNLSDTGATTSVTGLTYQWQISTNGGSTWTNIAGADSINHYETAGITAPTCYRRSITCGSSTTYSTPACVGINPVYLCPCGPNTGTTLQTGTLPSLDSVNIVGTVLALNTAGAPNNGYTLHLNPVPTLNKGVTYTLYTQYSTTAIASAWIDWNNDGIFDASEWIQLTTSGTNSTITFTVPSTATVDSTLMRIRTNYTFYSNGSGDACTSFFAGETEDFLIYIAAGTTCSGTPTPGTTIQVSPNVLCANTSFNLDVTGATANLAGLTYQWQSSTDGTIWSDISGATNPTFTNSAGISDSVFYRRNIFCSGFQSSSTSLLVKLSGAVSSYPFVESFESLTTVGAGILPNCWTTVGTTPKFTSANSAVRNKIGARTGTHCVWTKYSTNAYLISPSLDLKGGQTYYFWYYYRPTDPDAGFSIRTLVANASDTTSLSASQLGTTIVNPMDTSKWTVAYYSYTPPSSGTYYFAINSIATVVPWDLLFDDINISLTTLPVNMIQFKGFKDGKNNFLTWTTTKETDNKGFDVLRSTDGNNFNKIGFVPSKSENGNSTANLDYNFNDLQPTDGNDYYRLRQTDINGKETYSDIVMIKGIKSSKIEFTAIYPNPARNKLTMNIASPSTQNLNIVITDISGRILKQQAFLANSGDNQFNINVSELMQGTFLIKASCNNGCESAIQKFIKQ